MSICPVCLEEVINHEDQDFCCGYTLHKVCLPEHLGDYERIDCED